MTEGRRQEIEQNLSRVHSDWRAFSVRAPQDIADLLAEVKALRAAQRLAFRAGFNAHPGDLGGWAFVESVAADRESEAFAAWERDSGLRAGEEER